jgi:hypothetical protein
VNGHDRILCVPLVGKRSIVRLSLWRLGKVRFELNIPTATRANEGAHLSYGPYNLLILVGFMAPEVGLEPTTLRLTGVR